MLRFIVMVECENDGLDNPNDVQELAKVVTKVAVKLHDGVSVGTVKDSNGNTVANFSFTDGDDEPNYQVGRSLEA